MAIDPITPKNANPAQPVISPEDNAALQAIEAIEAQSVDLNPRPFNPAELGAPALKAPHAPPAPRVIEPIIEKPPIVAPRPLMPASVPKTTPPPVQAPPVPTPKPAIPQSTPKAAPVAPPKKRRPLSPAEAIAEELANSPPLDPRKAPFQPFRNQKPSKKALAITVVIILIVIVLGAGGYFFLQTR